MGSRLLGCVVAVGAKGLTVSLPHGLKGHVTPKETSDVAARLLKKAGAEGAAEALDLARAFAVGQLVRCQVVGLAKEQGSRVELSLRLSKLQGWLTPAALKPGMPLTAAVKSVEDHGVALHFGASKLAGFLPFAPGAAAEDHHVGAVLEVVVQSKHAKRGLVQAAAEPGKVAECALPDHAELGVPTLLPGSLVPAQVEQVLGDGLRLRFHTYFTGTVDCFHLPVPINKALEGLEGLFTEGERVMARVLYVHPTSKEIGLSLLPGLVGWSPRCVADLPPNHALFDHALVRRVDDGLGLLLALPEVEGEEGGEGGRLRVKRWIPGYVHVSNAADRHVDKLGKHYAVGQRVRARVVGARAVDGLASCTLKESVVNQKFAQYADVQPGTVLTCEYAGPEETGLVLQVAPGIRAHVPFVHVSDVGASKIPSKYHKGLKVKCLVLDVKPARKFILATLKKTLVRSEYPRICALDDAPPGAVAHGFVTGVQKYGVFVSFCNGMKGLAHRSQCGLGEEQSLEEAFTVGQPIKCRVVSVDKVSKNIKLSLTTRGGGAEAAAAGDDVRIGALVEGTVRDLVEGETHILVDITTASGAKAVGQLPFGHLSDSFLGEDVLLENLLPGDGLGEVVVLNKAGKDAERILVSRKQSLREAAAAGRMPQTIDGLEVDQALPGYIANITRDGVFVRFLGSLTGRAGLSQLADTFVSDPAQHFRLNQSVVALVTKLEGGKVYLNLKQSKCYSGGVALLASLLEDNEAAYALKERHEEDKSEEEIDWSVFAPGRVVTGRIHAVKDYGVVCDLDGHPDVIGLVNLEHMGGVEPAEGAEVTGRVLDVEKAAGYVDLSLRADLLQAPKKGAKKRKRQAGVGDRVPSRVELVKDEYLVVSYGADKTKRVGYIGAKDYNLRIVDPRHSFKIGAVVRAELMAQEQDSPAVLRLDMESPESLILSGRAQGKRSRTSSLEKGARVQGRVVSIQPLHAVVLLDDGSTGHLQARNLPATDEYLGDFPLRAFAEGEVRPLVVLGIVAHSKRQVYDVALEGADPEAAAALAAGDQICGYAHEVKGQYLWVVLPGDRRARMWLPHLLRPGDAPAGLDALKARPAPGQRLSLVVTRVVDDQVDVVLEDGVYARAFDPAAPAGGTVPVLRAGAAVWGIVSDLEPAAAVRLQVAPRQYGRVALVDLADAYVAAPVADRAPGQLVLCAVLAHRGTMLDLSTRPSRVAGAAGPRLKAHPEALGLPAPREAAHAVGGAVLAMCAEKAGTDYRKGDPVLGYVKKVIAKGCFVAVCHGVDALVKLRDLSDEFVADPGAAFPVGSLVRAKVAQVDAGGRVELSLRTRGDRKDREALKATWEALEEGQVVHGEVRRLAAYGAFVEFAGGVSGLCHVSQLGDGFVNSVEAVVAIGDRLTCRILKLDKEARKVSLTAKPSLLPQLQDAIANGTKDGEAFDPVLDAAPRDVFNRDAPSASASDSEDSEYGVEAADGAAAGAGKEGGEEEGESEEESESGEEAAPAPESESESESEEAPTTVAQELAAAELALNVETFAEEAAAAPAPAAPAEGPQGKSAKRREAKRRAAEREAEIERAERDRLANAAPRTEADFQGLILANPNSSYAWIRYMAHFLSIDEVGKAREKAAEALERINFREQKEKLNVWVALLNLELRHGQPSGEAAALGVFKRALPLCDPKKLHLALLGVLQRDMAGARDPRARRHAVDEVFKNLHKKFGQSCKVWLRTVEHHLQRGDAPRAQAALDRALQRLPKRKHIKAIAQNALLEYRAGDPERGRNLYESVLLSYPKRTDLWNVYLDQETKLHREREPARVRTLYQRITAMALPLKKMKGIFKRWLEFEEGLGDAAAAQAVKDRAMAFVEQRA